MTVSTALTAPPPPRLWSAAPPPEADAPGDAPREDGAAPQGLPRAPRESEAAEGAPRPMEHSPRLEALFGASGPRANALRAGAGLLAALPFAFVSSLATRATLFDQLVASVTLPLALALVATVGLTASTIGMSLLSQTIEVRDAIDVGARGLLRMGSVLAGLTPIAALWVASSSRIGEALIVLSLVWAIAGIGGLRTMNAGLLASAHPRGETSLGNVAILALLSLFTVVVGVRLWIAFIIGLDQPEFAS